MQYKIKFQGFLFTFSFILIFFCFTPKTLAVQYLPCTCGGTNGDVRCLQYNTTTCQANAYATCTSQGNSLQANCPSGDIVGFYTDDCKFNVDLACTNPNPNGSICCIAPPPNNPTPTPFYQRCTAMGGYCNVSTSCNGWLSSSGGLDCFSGQFCCLPDGNYSAYFGNSCTGSGGVCRNSTYQGCPSGTQNNGNTSCGSGYMCCASGGGGSSCNSPNFCWGGGACNGGQNYAGTPYCQSIGQGICCNPNPPPGGNGNPCATEQCGPGNICGGNCGTGGSVDTLYTCDANHNTKAQQYCGPGQCIRNPAGDHCANGGGGNPYCGDGICNNGENCGSCPQDCGACAPPLCTTYAYGACTPKQNNPKSCGGNGGTQYVVKNNINGNYNCIQNGGFNQNCNVNCTGGQQCVNGNPYGTCQNISISGFVYKDVNDNKIKDNGEPTYQNIIVTLSNGTTVTTNANGQYTFNNLNLQNYTVSIAANHYPAQTVPTTATQFTVNANANNGGKVTTTNINFGFTQFTLTGQVFIDANQNGIKDGAEIGYANPTLTLTKGGSTYQGTTTAGGNFTFQNLGPGTYTLTLTEPANYVFESENLANMANANPYTITLIANTTVNMAIAQSYTISGTVYDDYVDPLGYYNPPGDIPYAGSGPITITVVGTTNAMSKTLTTGSGITNSAYASGKLLSGTYTVTLIPPSTGGYRVTYPKPPAFQVNVGLTPQSPYSCNTNSAHDALCDATGNITNLNFGMTNENTFFQGVCTDLRSDTGFVDPLPASGTCGGITNTYASITDTTCVTPGVIYSGDNAFYFGQGAASTTGQVVGGTNYSANFTPVNPTIIRTSYTYVHDTAVQSGITPIDLSGIDSASGQPYCFGGISNCTLESNLPNGVYVANGDLTLTSATGTLVFPQNKAYVFLVNGNFTISTRMLVPTGSFVFFTSAKDTLVSSSVGESAVTSWDASIQGFFSADASFIIQSAANNGVKCNANGTNLDKRLNITGGIVVNANGTGGTLQNLRDLCLGDLSCPTYIVSMGDGNASGTNTGAGIGSTYLLYAPQFLKHPNISWQEQAP